MGADRIRIEPDWNVDTSAAAMLSNFSLLE